MINRFAITLGITLILSSLAYAKSIHEELVTAMTSILDQQKQEIFDGIHPMGTAKNVKLHELTIKWKNDKESSRAEDILAITVRYTLYWTSPLHDDGYTKISSTLDLESERWSSQLLATNGSTNEDAGTLIGNVIGTFMQYEAQKAGAERAAQDYINSQ